jgi:hypothetical protein
MPSLWENYDLPILKRILEFEAYSGSWPEAEDIQEALEEGEEVWELDEVMVRLVALAEAEPPFMKAKFIKTGQRALPVRAIDARLTERGYRAVGAWPSADPYEQLMKLLAERIDAEDQPEVKGKLERFRESVQGIGREVVVGVLTSLARQTAGLP